MSRGSTRRRARRAARHRNHDRSRPNGDADKTIYDGVRPARLLFRPRRLALHRSGRRTGRSRRPTGLAEDGAGHARAESSSRTYLTGLPPKPLKPLDIVDGLEFAGEARVEQRVISATSSRGTSWRAARSSSRRLARRRRRGTWAIHAFWAADHRGVTSSPAGGSPLIRCRQVPGSVSRTTSRSRPRPRRSRRTPRRLRSCCLPSPLDRRLDRGRPRRQPQASGGWSARRARRRGFPARGCRAPAARGAAVAGAAEVTGPDGAAIRRTSRFAASQDATAGTQEPRGAAAQDGRVDAGLRDSAAT